MNGALSANKNTIQFLDIFTENSSFSFYSFFYACFKSILDELLFQ